MIKQNPAFREWSLPAIRRPAGLRPFDFVNDRTGWITLDGLERTDDGADTWRKLNDEQNLVIDFVDANRGFAVRDLDRGPLATLIRTVDGGVSWEAISPPNLIGPILGVAVVDASRVVVVRSSGVAFTADGGRTWSSSGAKTASFPRGDLSPLDLPVPVAADSEDVWLAMQPDFMRCGGAGCVKPFGQGLDQLAVHDRGRAIASALTGRAWVSSDGTKPWQAIEWSNAAELVVAFQARPLAARTQLERAGEFVDLSHVSAFTVSREGGIWMAGTNRRSWVARSEPEGGWAVYPFEGEAIALSALDSQHAWALRPFYELLRTADGGAQWTSVNYPWGPEWEPPNAIALAAPARGWIVGDGGLIAATQDGGSSWIKQVSDTKVALRSVFFLDESHGWVGGDDGTLLMTVDAGRAWKRVRIDSPAPFRESIRSIVFSDRQRGWLAGSGGSLLHTADGARSWTDQLPYRRLLPPWYFASLAVVGLLLLPALRPPRRQDAPMASVGEMLASDRPLVEGEPDVLGLREVALGISRFLRNENTLPPLTIAITGEWGTGKSSLMNLLRADLARFGFRPVVFNAWHHQKEEHLLASLLECIRSQAVPKRLTLENLSFRWRLLARRGLRYPVLLAALLVSFAVSVGYTLTHEHPKADLAWMLGRAEELAIRWGLRENAAEATHESETAPVAEVEAGHTSLLVIALTGLGLLLSLLRGLQAFGIRPGALLARTAQAASPRALGESVGLRHQFAREFADVTQALNPRTLTIFIDDLDRCRPQNVLDLLESVSFLVTSGECFVVLGMAKEWVVGCVGLAFKEVAAELSLAGASRAASNGVAASATDDGSTERRAAFALAYLEKLVNIEVPVPRATAAQSRELLTSMPRSGALATPVMGSGLRGMAILTAAALLLVVGLVVGARLAPLAPAPETKEQSAAAGVAAASEPGAGATASPTARPVEPPARGESGVFFPAAPSRTSFSWIYLLGAALAAVGAWRLAQRPELVVRDSPEFTGALQKLYPALAGRLTTPRRVKRFMNRLRYYAMRQRALEPPATLWDRLRRRLRRGEEAVAAEPANDVLGEAELVLLATLHEVAPRLLSGALDDAKRERRVAELAAAGIPAEVARQLAWQWPQPSRIALFERLAESVSVR